MNPTENQLYRCPMMVRPGPDCDLPSQFLGAYVDCFVAAPEEIEALRLAVGKLHELGYTLEELADGDMQLLDPLQWDEFVKETWPEFADTFIKQAEMPRFLQEGVAFFGPFCGWESEDESIIGE